MSFFKIFLILFFLLTHIYANKGIAIIVSKDSTIDTISKNHLKKIFLLKTKKLPNGKKPITVELEENTICNYFYKTVCKKEENQVQKYWTTMIFTGRGLPPKKIKDINSLIDFIKNTPNAISYIPLSYKTDEVKTILEIK